MEEPPRRRLKSHFPKWSWKLNLILFLAFILFIIGIFAPILTFEKFFIFSNRVSIISGLFQLVSEGHLVLFALIFLFSIVLPLMKMVFLFSVWNGGIRHRAGHDRLMDWIGRYGKWSMLDVFVAAILVVTIKLRAIADVDVHVGLYAFACSVILTMMATSKISSLSASEE